jgi:outer membrane biosynthesis protein TonB
MLNLILSSLALSAAAPAIDPQDIRDGVHKHKDAINGCYAAALTADNKLAGTVTTRFVIGPDGKVKKASIVKSTIKNPKMETCLTVELKKMSFPKPRTGGDDVIDYPFDFGSVEEAPQTRTVAGAPSTEDPAAVQKGIGGHAQTIKACFDTEAAKNKGLAGLVMTRFVIAGDGKVSEATVANSTLKNATVEGCILTTLKGIVFPPTNGGGPVSITFPFNFGSKPASLPAEPVKK